MAPFPVRGKGSGMLLAFALKHAKNMQISISS